MPLSTKISNKKFRFIGILIIARCHHCSFESINMDVIHATITPDEDTRLEVSKTF